jgi:hypothetical protein
MDWEKATKVGTVSSIAGLVIGLYSIMPSTSVSQEGDLVKSLIPSIIIGSAILLASIFNLLAFFMRRRKLKSQIDSLTGSNERLIEEKQGLDEALVRTKSDASRLQKQVNRYSWLTALADDQKIDIDEYVLLKEFTFFYMEPLTPSIYRVVFGLFVTNNSVLDIGLSNELGGLIRFEGTELAETKRVISSLEDAHHCKTRSLTIEQRLSVGEAQTIGDARYAISSRFEFDDLIVTIVGGGRSPDVTPRRLKIARNTFVNAFPASLLERGQRIRALSEIRGSCVQLHETLRISSQQPLSKVIIEAWKTAAMATLERAYTEAGAKQVFKEISYDKPIPEEATSQGNWLRGCIVVLGELITRETGEYIRQPV